MSETKRDTKQDNRFKVILAVAVFITLAVFVSSFSLTELTGKAVIKEEQDLENFTKCLTQKSIKLYGIESERTMKTQKKIFGESFKNLYYVDCMENRDKCGGILTYPTWKIDGKLVNGALSLDMLSKFSGCEL